MTRAILYDITHLEHRSRIVAAPTGIDRVDLLYARYFASRQWPIAGAVRYAIPRPNMSPAHDVGAAVAAAELRWSETAAVQEDEVYRAIRGWLTGGPKPKPSKAVAMPKRSRRNGLADAMAPRIRAWSALRTATPPLPTNALYLNIAQHAAEIEAFFAWKKSRQDVAAVFFVHDLLPLDYPEFWWDGHEDIFARRVDTILGAANAIVTSTQVARSRILSEFHKRRLTEPPVFAQALPSPLGELQVSSLADASLQSEPYFVVVGTIEPRKNHALLFNVWRRLAERSSAPPKLVVIGARGWENAETVSLLERCPAIDTFVAETPRLSNAGLSRVLANACGLLMPSLAEGFGLPPIEALGLGTPVVASDIEVFHETTQDCAIYCDPLDGPLWGRTVQALSDRGSAFALEARARAKMFRPMKEDEYFRTLESFLATL